MHFANIGPSPRTWPSARTCAGNLEHSHDRMTVTITQFGGHTGSFAGDCAVVEVDDESGKHVVIIDTGDSVIWDSNASLANYVRAPASSKGAQVILVTTYFHRDHFNTDVVGQFRNGELSSHYFSKQAATSANFTRLSNGGKWNSLGKGTTSIQLGPTAQMTFYVPPPTLKVDDQNDQSMASATLLAAAAASRRSWRIRAKNADSARHARAGAWLTSRPTSARGVPGGTSSAEGVLAAVAAALRDGLRPEPVRRRARRVHRFVASLASSPGKGKARSGLGRGRAVRCGHLYPVFAVDNMTCPRCRGAMRLVMIANKHTAESRVGPPRNLGDLLAGGGAERVETQLALVVPHVHAVKYEAMKVHVEPQRGVGALDEGDRTEPRVFDRTQAKLRLRSATKRATQRDDERVEHVSAQLSVVAHRVGQPPWQRARRSRNPAPPSYVLSAVQKSHSRRSVDSSRGSYDADLSS
ncbi:hypothetical protein DB30_05687 [Enhygromyxa salina]|uniref:Uncharacterized protein n=1 Tax=Enhygromyxa salina TaxID=215803 RepID=A0A0C2D0I6_9BACT|nr:hypothetical protein DB30_05687 [Enhygromyxa salina]